MVTKSQKLATAGAAFLIAEPALAFAHAGGIGAVLGAVAGVAAYVYADDLAKMVGRDIESPPIPAPVKKAGKPSIGYRLLNGKSARETDVQASEAAHPDPPRQATNGQMLAIPRQFVLSGDTLEAIKEVNRKGFVYFGQSPARQVVLHIDDMYHVLDVAKSGRGKSNRFRNAMMQVVGLADTYYLNPFAAPVKSVTDERKIEVWQPIYDRLVDKRPARSSGEIMQTLTGLVNKIEIRSDQEQDRDFSWREHPVFAFIDEVPEIHARCPDAVKLLDRIGRGGRQFGVFVWIATQSALVQDIGLSTASQAQFKTLIYGGGDKTSGSRVLGSVSAEQEKMLKTNGAGLTLMIADGVDDTEYVRAPLITNEALFSYLELPPFSLEEWLHPRGARLLSPSTLSPEETVQAQKPAVEQGETVKGESGKRVKGPNEEIILEAMAALEEEQKPLTLNAIAKRAGLTHHQYDAIEATAIACGYELDRGKGRPAKES